MCQAFIWYYLDTKIGQKMAKSMEVILTPPPFPVHVTIFSLPVLGLITLIEDQIYNFFIPKCLKDGIELLSNDKNQFRYLYSSIRCG